jgi:hypothetical protein
VSFEITAYELALLIARVAGPKVTSLIPDTKEIAAESCARWAQGMLA